MAVGATVVSVAVVVVGAEIAGIAPARQRGKHHVEILSGLQEASASERAPLSAAQEKVVERGSAAKIHRRRVDCHRAKRKACDKRPLARSIFPPSARER